MDRRRALISGFLVLLGIVACAWTTLQPEHKSVVVETAVTTSESESVIEEKEPETATYPVYICGAVMMPGIYDLHGPVYLYQLIELAGGLSENADEIHIDRVYLIEHAQSIYIPSLSDIDSEPTVHEFYTPTSATENSSGKKGDKVDINSASADELASLPGIGKKTAQKIVEYRELNGRFESIEDIMKVSGIGESKFATIKDCIFTG